MPELDRLYANAAMFPNLLRDVTRDYSIDEVMEQETKKLEDAGDGILGFDVRFVEQNISDVAALLDRVFSLRREIIEIEAARIKAGLAYLYGLEAIDDELALELAKTSPGNKRIKDAAEAKAQHGRDAILALEERHGIDGGALNYTQHRAKLEARLKQELGEAYVRSRTVSLGMAWIDEMTLKFAPFPKVGEARYVSFDGARHLDDWLAWYRGTVIRLEKVQQQQIFVDATLSLGSAANYAIMRDGVRQVDQTVLVPNLRDLILKYQPIEIDFEFGQAGWPFPLELGSRCLLRGIGLTMAIADEHSKKWRYSALISMPNVTAPVSVGVIPNFESGPEWLTDPIVYNQRVPGKWHISILPNPLRDADAGDRARLASAAWPFWDVQLYLRAAFY